MAPYLGYDSETFFPRTLNSDLTITGGGITQTGGDINLDSGTLFLDEDLNRVGIGTTNPLRTLHIYSSSPIRFSDQNRVWDINIKAGKLVIGDDTGSADRLTIDTSGNVGIGTTNPEDRLDLASGFIRFKEAIGGTGTYGGIRAYNSLVPSVSATAIRFIRDVAEVGNDGAICFDTTNNERVRISSTGNVGIGTTNPSTKLHVIGTVTATAFVGDGSGLTNVSGGGGGGTGAVDALEVMLFG